MINTAARIAAPIITCFTCIPKMVAGIADPGSETGTPPAFGISGKGELPAVDPGTIAPCEVGMNCDAPALIGEFDG